MHNIKTVFYQLDSVPAGGFFVTASHRPFDVIVIDDEEDIREVLRVPLEDAGCRVCATAGGKQGRALGLDLNLAVPEGFIERVAA